MKPGHVTPNNPATPCIYHLLPPSAPHILLFPPNIFDKSTLVSETQSYVMVSALSVPASGFIAVGAEDLASHRYMYVVENVKTVDKAMPESSGYRLQLQH